ncbi:TRAP-type C4-dicarboxylate transport system, substrate-binding protein [Aliiroseovarius crassostreae]|uniref:C4-dicarboxylate ABC transporter substrate-binding protein n=1 Tax=Aliiroseovarius crassostreae TaxID=154981 RepID=A0A0P7KN90_9RHOB|nr:TRAP transporter substrate-binding protein DctP [Aliiroseovarius crassostreae]KPN63615.1 hypothetical protein AKJ29_13350 [Aliiroseovarius crassostreae]SFU89926.1 TRAP-type C4-dicarboxylate transport system, substrate-binding protein [Aliiroseovarius crassostreae]
MKPFLKKITLGAIFAALPFVAAADEIKLNAVSLAPKQASIAAGFHVFVDEVNREFADEIKINWRGGPEVMPPFKQAEAVRNGAIDMTFTSPSYYSGLIPSSSTLNMSFKTYDEIAATDYHERMTEIHAEKGLVYLGEVPATDLSFLIYLKEPVSSLEDLKGKRIRVFPTLVPLIEALGATPIVLPIGEIYTALERGTIDGFMQGPIDAEKQFEGVISAVVYPGVYRAAFPILVNEKSWNELPEDLQSRLITFVRDDLSPRIEQIWAEKVAASAIAMEAAGFQRIDLSEEETALYRKIAIDAAWSVIAENAGEELAAELRAMLVD